MPKKKKTILVSIWMSACDVCVTIIERRMRDILYLAVDLCNVHVCAIWYCFALMA